MDTAHWPQDIVVKPIEEIVTNTCTPKQPVLERKARPQKEQALNCPRCNSTNTKFCYYNNYSLTQPRYFCKTCRRYWTEGGSLRNIPVGGGSRKNKRPSSSSSSSSSKNNNKLPDLINTVPHQIITTTTTNLSHQGQDLNLAFPSTQGFANISELVQVPAAAANTTNNNGSSNNNENDQIAPSSNNTSTNSISALELLTGMSSRGLNSFMHHMQPSDHHHHQHQDPNNDNTVYTHGLIPMHDFKPSLNFSVDGINGSNGTTSGGYGNLHQGVQENSGRLLFPFEDLKQVSSTNHEQNINRDHHHHQQGDSAAGYWTGMLGGGSW